MIGRPGPFQIVESGGCGIVDAPVAPPRRRYDCPNYESCLNLAAALNWDNFTCRGCNGEIDETLCWRAHQAQKKDVIVRTLCDLPDLKFHRVESPVEELVKIVAKR